MVVRKKKIKIDGKEMEIEVFDTSLIPGSGTEEESIDSLLREEEIEKEIKNVILKIKKKAEKYPKKDKNTSYYYEVGQVLQFVDEKNIAAERGKIWHRLAYDLEPSLFGGKKKNPNEAKRHPEFMYLLAKVDKKYLNKANWDQWYEILKFKDIFKKQKVLLQILNECKSRVTGPSLRAKIKRILSKK